MSLEIIIGLCVVVAICWVMTKPTAKEVQKAADARSDAATMAEAAELLKFKPPTKAAINRMQAVDELRALETSLWSVVERIDNVVGEYSCSGKLAERSTARLEAKGEKIMSAADDVAKRVDELEYDRVDA